MAIINSNEKKILFIILAMISVSKMKNSVYNLIGLENSCICDNYLTELFCQLRLLLQTNANLGRIMRIMEMNI